MPTDPIQILGLVAAVIVPFFNIPLIVKIVQRKSSEDISLIWAFGVWTCLLLMVPSGLCSKDIVWRAFNIVNIIFFSGVLFVTLKYYKWGKNGKS